MIHWPGISPVTGANWRPRHKSLQITLLGFLEDVFDALYAFSNDTLPHLRAPQNLVCMLTSQEHVRWVVSH